jgi:hypothetical protein
LKFKETSPAQRKKVPSILEFQTAKPLPFSKSPKRRRNYSAPFFFQKKKTEKNKPEFKKKEGRNPLYCHQPAFGKKMLEIQGNQPSLAKKVPSIFEFQTAKPLPFSKSPKRRKNYSSTFFFPKKKYEKTSPK